MICLAGSQDVVSFLWVCRRGHHWRIWMTNRGWKIYSSQSDSLDQISGMPIARRQSWSRKTTMFLFQSKSTSKDYLKTNWLPYSPVLTYSLFCLPFRVMGIVNGEGSCWNPEDCLVFSSDTGDIWHVEVVGLMSFVRWLIAMPCMFLECMSS